MDSEKNLASLKEQVRRFCETRDWDKYHGAKDLAIGIITESSELLEYFRFKSDAEVEEILKDPKKRAEVSDELADVLYFLLRLSQKYNFDLSDALEKKMKENEKKYPVSKSFGSNKKYTEF